MVSEPWSCPSRRGGPLLPLVAAASLCLVAFGIVPLGHAQPTEEQQDTARELMVRGDELYDQEQYAQALERFRGADAIMGVPSTQVAVARTLRALGRLREARAGARVVAASPGTTGEPPAFAHARQEARALVEELDGAIPTVQVSVTGPFATAVVVTIDGQPAAEQSWQRPVPLDPGAHVIDVSAPGHRSHVAEIALREGERRRLEVTLLPSSSVEPIPPATPAVPESPTPEPSALPYVAFGFAGAGVVIGAATGIASLVGAADVKAQCDGNRCPPSAEADADEGKRLAWASNISFGVAILGTAVGTIALLLEPDEPTSSGRQVRPPIRLAVGPASLGIDVTF